MAKTKVFHIICLSVGLATYKSERSLAKSKWSYTFLPYFKHDSKPLHKEFIFSLGVMQLTSSTLFRMQLVFL